VGSAARAAGPELEVRDAGEPLLFGRMTVAGQGVLVQARLAGPFTMRRPTISPQSGL
jgi:hypothetical protein